MGRGASGFSRSLWETRPAPCKAAGWGRMPRLPRVSALATTRPSVWMRTRNRSHVRLLAADQTEGAGPDRPSHGLGQDRLDGGLHHKHRAPQKQTLARLFQRRIRTRSVACREMPKSASTWAWSTSPRSARAPSYPTRVGTGRRRNACAGHNARGHAASRDRTDGVRRFRHSSVSTARRQSAG